MPDEYDRYRAKRSFIGRMPAWLKACLVKTWLAGAVFYFVGWGMFVKDILDLVIALGLVHGLVIDLLVNRILVYFETDKISYRRFLLAYSHRFLSVPVNLIYGTILSFCVAYTYHFVNYLFFLGAEPILYGLLFMSFDMLFVSVKRLFKGLFKR